MIKGLAGLLTGFWMFVAVFAPSLVTAKNAASLQVKGSDTMVNLIQGWSEEFMKKNPKVFIAVTGGGSGVMADLESRRHATPQPIEHWKSVPDP